MITLNKKIKEKKYLIGFLSNLLIASIPFFIIILIFTIYIVFGAIILNELEISDKESNQITNKYLSFKEYQLKLSEIFLKVLFNIRKHQTHIADNYKLFLNRLDRLLIENIYNISQQVVLKESYFYNTKDNLGLKEKKYLNSKKFIAKVFKIHNENSIYLLQHLADHLIETQNNLRHNISKNMKNLIVEYKYQYKYSEKKLFKFIYNYENMLQNTKKLIEFTILKNEKENMNKLENKKNKLFIKTFFYVINLMTTTGIVVFLIIK